MTMEQSSARLVEELDRLVEATSDSSHATTLEILRLAYKIAGIHRRTMQTIAEEGKRPS